MAEKNLIKIYVNAISAKRVDIIIRHYTDFMGIVDGYTEGLRYMIECAKESNSRQLCILDFFKKLLTPTLRNSL